MHIMYDHKSCIEISYNVHVYYASFLKNTLFEVVRFLVPVAQSKTNSHKYSVDSYRFRSFLHNIPACESSSIE